MDDDLSQSADKSCNISIVKDQKFVDDGDLSSTDSDSEDCNFNRPKRYNKLNPKANFVYRLLKSVRPKSASIWKNVTIPLGSDLLNHSITITSNTMAKNDKKRKHDRISSDEKDSHQRKKSLKRYSDVINLKKVNHKKQAHSVSSSDNEERPSRSKHKTKKTNNKDFKVVNNYSHLLSSEGDSSTENDKIQPVNNSNLDSSIPEFEHEVYVNGQNDRVSNLDEDCQDSDNEFNETRDMPDQNDNSATGVRSSQKDEFNYHGNIVNEEQLYEEPNCTARDEEEISKFSFLLSEDLSKKNSIWFFQCPKNMNCSRVVNQYLDLGGSCQLDDGEYAFEAYSHRNNHCRSATLAVPSEHNQLKLCTIPISGSVIVEESVRIDNKISYNIPEQPGCVELPEILQTRHPLLGTNYENQPRTVFRKKSLKKKKKHSKMDSSNVSVPEIMKEDTLLSSSINESRKRKRKKSKDDLSNLSVSVSESLSSNSVDHIKKKKKRSHRHNEDNLTDFSVSVSESLSCNSVDHMKKKKKSSHRHNKDSITDISLHDQNLNESFESSKVKRKKKHTSDASC